MEDDFTLGSEDISSTPATRTFPFRMYHLEAPERTVVSETAIHVEQAMHNSDTDELVGYETCDVEIFGELATVESLLQDIQNALAGVDIDAFNMNTIHAMRYKFTDGTIVVDCIFGFGPGGRASRGVGQVIEGSSRTYSFQGMNPHGFGIFSLPDRTKIQLIAGKTKIFRNAKVCIFPVRNSAVPCQPNVGDPATNLRNGVLVADALPTTVYNGGGIATAEDPISNIAGWQIPACCR